MEKTEQQQKSGVIDVDFALCQLEYGTPQRV